MLEQRKKTVRMFHLLEPAGGGSGSGISGGISLLHHGHSSSSSAIILPSNAPSSSSSLMSSSSSTLLPSGSGGPTPGSETISGGGGGKGKKKNRVFSSDSLHVEDHSNTTTSSTSVGGGLVKSLLGKRKTSKEDLRSHSDDDLRTNPSHHHHSHSDDAHVHHHPDPTPPKPTTNTNDPSTPQRSKSKEELRRQRDALASAPPTISSTLGRRQSSSDDNLSARNRSSSFSHAYSSTKDSSKWNSPMFESNLLDFMIAGFSQRLDPREHDYDHEMDKAYDSSQQLLLSKMRTIQGGADLRTADAQITHRVGSFDHDSRLASCLRFHSFSPLMIMADEFNRIAVYQYETGTMLRSFHNLNPANSRISAIRLMNEAQDPMLITGSNEGVVRVWKDYMNPDREQKERLVSSWWAVKPGWVGSHLCLSWSQDSGFLFSGGCNSSTVKCWDMEREMCVQEIDTGSAHPVSALACEDEELSRTLVVGCGDGQVLLYDSRAPDKYNCVATWKQHSSHIVGCFAQKTKERKIVAGDKSGKVVIWDRRMNKMLGGLQIDPISCMAVHPFAPTIACGCGKQQHVVVLNTKGEFRNSIRHFDGFLVSRIGVVRSLAFHPCRLLLGMGSAERHISIFTDSSRTG